MGEKINIAAGEPVETGKQLGSFDPRDFIMRLLHDKFNGYLCVTTKGKTGFEEGVLVINDGVLISSDYEYYRYNQSFKADEGLKRVLNAMLSKNGVVDLFSLSPYQVQLILALNEQCNLKERMDEKTLIMPNEFSYAFEQQLGGAGAETEEASREALLKKYGLVKLSEPNVTRGGLMQGARDEHQKIKELLEEG